MQQLPPDTSNSGAESPETQNMLHTAYVWAQLEVARSSVESAYKMLKQFKKKEVPASTVEASMSVTGDLVAETMKMVNEAKSNGGE